MYGDCDVLVGNNMGEPFMSPSSMLVAQRLLPQLPSNMHMQNQRSLFSPSNGLSLAPPKRMREGNQIAESMQFKAREEENESKSGSGHMEGGSGEDQDAADQQQQQPRRKRYHRHTARQIQEMEALFKECPHPDDKQRQRLSIELGLKPRQVKFWFQNRRTQMKAQQDRTDNAILRVENDSLRNENLTLREAVSNVICPNCGGPSLVGDMAYSEQHLRLENSRLKDELDRVSCIASKYLGRSIPTLTPIAAPPLLTSSLDLGMGSFGKQAPLHSSHEMPPFAPFPDVGMTSGGAFMDMDKSLALQLAMNCTDELIRMAQTDDPLWLKTNANGVKEVLNSDEYDRLFSWSMGFNFKHTGSLRIEATRDSAVVFLNAGAVVDHLTDVSKWTDMFACLVTRAKTVQILSPNKLRGCCSFASIMAFEVATAIFLALAALLLIAKQLRKNNINKLPRPPSWPIIGHLHLLTKKLPIHRNLYSLSERYGPIMHLQLGYRPVMVITSSLLAKECLTTNDRVFASRPRLSAGEHMGYHYKMLGWAPYGSYWRNIRKICTLQLFSANRIQSFKHVRAEETSALIRSLFESCSQQEGKSTVNMKSRLAQLTFSIIVRMVAGKLCLGPDEYEELQHFREMINEGFYLAGAFNLEDYLPFLKWLDVQGLKAAMEKLQKRRDAFMQTLVNNHCEKRGTHTEDLIDVLISATGSQEILSDNNADVVKANAINIIDGGTDTSSVTIEWALAAMLQNPNILQKAQKELDTYIGHDRVIEESDLPRLKYLEAIVKETLRLYPAAPLLVPHESTEACTVGGFHVPAGTRLIVNAWAIHRDPAVWERPTEFDPERFLKGEKDTDVKGQDFELIPFGSGRRMCPALSLALCVVTYTLGRLLQSFEWSIPAGTIIEMKEGYGLTMPRAIPLEAAIKPRLLPHLY